ncbi:hypothetical protein E3N88_24627 [Mikania micrantha]|uniref:Uncharacterized protein n=1 Tax=Mikania micrantha TaxID=192012 RepID=A0A5N6N2E2_9ASTR|nr:hypothetical protein E3N88_24627 [Mikania micrantha]
MEASYIENLSSDDDNQGTEKRKAQPVKSPIRNGTSALNRHITSCEKHPEKLKGQTNIFLKKNDDVGAGPSGEVKSWKFCAKTSRKAIAEMVILDELPFTSVEKEGFKKLMVIDLSKG